MTNKHLFSRLHKWGIANDPAVVAERFTEACFVERFGRRSQSQPKTSVLSVISVAKNLCNLWLKKHYRLFQYILRKRSRPLPHHRLEEHIRRIRGRLLQHHRRLQHIRRIFCRLVQHHRNW